MANFRSQRPIGGGGGRTTIRSENLTWNEVSKKDTSHDVHKNAKVSQVKSDLI